MTVFQPTVQRRLGRGGRGSLNIEDLAIGANNTRLGDVRIGIALKGVDKALTPAQIGGLTLTVSRGRRRVGAYDALFCVLLHRELFSLLLTTPFCHLENK